jgi:uncharacterized protein
MMLKSDSDVFRIGRSKLVGVWSRIEGARSRFPAVLLLHGFPGSEKNVDVARELLKRGIGGYRLHFRGAWGSEGIYRFTNLVEEARAGLRRMESMPGVDASRLGVFGFSFGGWTALHLAPTEPVIRAVAVVAPVGPEMVRGQRPSAAGRRRITHMGRPLRIGSEAALYRDFQKAVLLDPAPSARRIDVPLLLVHGEADEVVPCSVSKRVYAAANEPKTLLLEPGARHDFLDRRERLASIVADWLAERLVPGRAAAKNTHRNARFNLVR